MYKLPTALWLGWVGLGSRKLRFAYSIFHVCWIMAQSEQLEWDY